MSLTIELPLGIETRLTRAAEKAGKTLPQFAGEVLGRVADMDSGGTLAELDEFLAPFRKQVAESGMTEDELDAFFQDVRQEIWDEQHGGKP